jgi:hypothetical protein
MKNSNGIAPGSPASCTLIFNLQHASPSRSFCIGIKIRLQVSEAKFTFGPAALISGSMMVRKQAHPFFLKLPSASFQVDPASNWHPLVASHLEVENDGSTLCSDSLHNRPNGSRNNSEVRKLLSRRGPLCSAH